MTDLTRHVFDRHGDDFVPTVLATGPWDPRLQGGVTINALIAHLVEVYPCPAEMVIARLVIDIMKPTRMDAIQTRIEVLREGKRLQLLQIEVLQDGVATVRATALRVRVSDSPGTEAIVYPPPSPELPGFHRTKSPMHHIVETRLESGGLEVIGPGVVWSRIDGEILPGTAITPFVQAAMAADFGSGLSSIVNWREWSFANVDITLHLARMPHGPWLRIAAASEGAGNGLAVVHSRLADELGEFGHAHQTLFLDRRSSRTTLG